MATAHLLYQVSAVLVTAVVIGGLVAYWLDSSYLTNRTVPTEQYVRIVNSSWREQWLNNSTSSPVRYAPLSGSCLSVSTGLYPLAANFTCYFLNTNVTRTGAINGSDVKVEIVSVVVNPPFRIVGPAQFYQGVPNNWQVFGVEFETPASPGSYTFSGVVNFEWFS